MVMVMVRVRVILGYDVIINTFSGACTKLQTAVRQISPTTSCFIFGQKKVGLTFRTVYRLQDDVDFHDTIEELVELEMQVQKLYHFIK